MTTVSEQTVRETAEQRYEIRPFEAGDRDGFLDLYRSVMGARKSQRWFAWKYAENPYTDDVPMFVATQDGEVVGARPFFALPLACEGEQHVALQPADTMVHADHRRQGLFTRMTEAAIDAYDEYACFFNFPNHRSRPGYLKMGWEIVSERPSYYRVERPRSLLGDSADTPVRLASTLAAPLFRAYTALRETSVNASQDISIQRQSEVPARELERLYKHDPPDQIHAARDAELFEWRFGNPDWEYWTYLADIGGDPIAAVVTGTRQDGRTTITKLTEVLPLGDTEATPLRTLLSAILEDFVATDLFVAPAQGVPSTVLSQFGFLRDDRLPLSRVATPTTHVVRPLAGTTQWTEIPLSRQSSWYLTFVEEDTS